jgi:myo-inositol-1(or 4)-monophosphatase
VSVTHADRDPRDPRFDDALADQVLAAMAEAARAGERIIRAGAARLGALVWESKGRADFLTEVDRDSENAIRESLERALRDVLPGARVLGEETWSGDAIPADPCFVVDPLDGTTNFLHGVPVYAVSIGALVNGAPVAGVVLDVARDELYAATRGRGATLDDAPIRVSSVTERERALIATGFPFGDGAQVHRFARQFIPVAEATAGIRRAGAAALDLAGVACGRYEAYWELDIAPWDIAAGILLVEEAGGIVTGIDGARASVTTAPIVAGSPVMHRWLLETVQRADAGAGA